MSRRRLLAAALVGALTFTHIWITDRFLVPAHQAGKLQPILAPLCGLAHTVTAPGRLVAKAALGEIRQQLGWEQTFLAAAIGSTGVALLAYATLGVAALALQRGRQRIDTGDLSRRRFLRAAAGSGLAGVTGAGGYAFLLEPRRITTRRLEIEIADLPPSLAGLRLVQLTDLHLGPWITTDFLAGAVQLANGLRPDLVLLTGDYVHRSPEYIEPVVDVLRGLRASIGVVGVLGNHDWWEDGPRCQAAFARAEIPLLDNARRILTPDRRLLEAAEEGLAIAGVGDLWEDQVSFERAVGGLPAHLPRIVLSHNPDVVESGELLGAGHRVDLILSGHTHGGQVCVPGVGPIFVPSRYGRKYAEGLIQGPRCPVFVSRGLGMTVFPFRFAAAPEVVEITLRPPRPA